MTELIPELAFNAIKHAKTKSIEFLIQSEEKNLVRLSCLHSGSRTSDSGKVGLGTRLLEECALSWTRHSVDSGTLTTLLLPYVPKKSSSRSGDSFGA